MQTDFQKPMTPSEARDNQTAQAQPGSGAASGYGHAPGFTYFVDSEIGMTMGDTTVKQLPDGTWKATCPIGTLFGSEVEGECNGTGPTKEAALEALTKVRKNLNDSLWAERPHERRRGQVTLNLRMACARAFRSMRWFGRDKRKNMKQKQLEEIKSLRSRLSNLGTGNAPSLERHVMIALCSGEVPKLKPAVAISDTARNQIINERYSGRSLKFSDVFASTNGYEGEMSQWKAHEAKRKTALARFDKDAEKIMVKAMDSESDAAEIVEQLHEAADRAGLKALKAPVFGESE